MKKPETKKAPVAKKTASAKKAATMKPESEVQKLRLLTPDQLQDEVLKLKKEQFNLRFQRATGQLENTSRVRVIRRTIAKIKTVQGQKAAATAKA